MDKKYLVSVLIYLVTGILALALIAFVIYHLAGFDETSYTTAVALSADAERGIEGEGWIFRSEKLLTASDSGSVYCALSDGENVAAGDEVGVLYEENEDVIEALSRCDRALVILKEAGAGASLAECTAKVKALCAEMRANIQKGKCEAMLSEMTALETALDRRSNVSGAVQNFDREIARLEEQRNALIASLGEKKETLTAPAAGNYYKSSDGYESVFAFELADTLEPSTFEELLSSLGAPVDRGVGKLCTGSLWKLLIVADKEDTVLLSAGKNYAVAFSDGTTMSMKLDRLANDNKTGQTLLVFSTRIQPAKSLSRCEHVKIVTYSETGLRVPAAALRCPEDQDGAVGVYVQSGNRIRFKKVEILTKQDGFYVVRAFPKTDKDHSGYLQENDIVLTSGKELTEGYLR